MKTNRPLFSLFLFALAVTLAPIAHAAEHARIQGLLISASSDRGETDRRLSAYEPTLRRILRFESYRFLGDDSASLDVPATGHLALGEGNELEIQTESSDGRSIRIKVRWLKNGRTLMSTGLALRPGVPAVIGGPSTGHKGDVYAVILIGR